MHSKPCLTAGPLGIYVPPRATCGTWQTSEKQGSRVLTRYCFGAFSALPSCDVAVLLGNSDYATTRASGIFAPAAETCCLDVPDL